MREAKSYSPFGSNCSNGATMCDAVQLARLEKLQKVNGSQKVFCQK
jgi:hypothetical protein